MPMPSVPTPDHEGIKDRLPATRPAPEADEDAPPRPISDGHPDVSVPRWPWSPLDRNGGEFFGAAGLYFVLVGLVVVACYLGMDRVVIPALVPLIGDAAYWVGVASACLLCIPLFVGPPHVAARALRGERWHIGHFFAGFLRPGQALLLTLLLTITVWVCIAPFVVAFLLTDRLRALGVAANGWLMAAPPLLGFAAVLYVWTRLAFAPILLLDRGMSATQALAASWRLTRHCFPELLVYHLMMSLALALGCVCTGGFMTVFLLPLTLIGQANAYLRATASLPVE
jgi:hypothetical protein